jgi:hypothetical protein
MTFNIGNQSGGIVNNVGRDQFNYGGQQAIVVPLEAAFRAVDDLRTAIRAARLDPAATARARAEIEELDRAMHAAPEPDRPAAATTVERLTTQLGRAGALATAGASLIGPLRTIAGWLGPLGERVLQILASVA